MTQRRFILPFQLLTLIGLLSFALPSVAQSSRQFQWKFANSAIADVIPSCAELAIIVQSSDPTTNLTNGVPPYYMLSFELGGTPQRTFIGTDDANLSWQVTHAPGSKLVLSVVDSTGGAGGIPPRVITVTLGQSTQCVVSSPTTPSFTVTSNVTTDLTTCQPWGLTVKGGVPPYNVTIVELNSPVTTNVTIPNGLDRFTYIDRADPGALLVAAVSDFDNVIVDSNGSWAFGTPSVNTNGPPVTDSSCIGLVSSSGNNTIIQQQLDAENATLQAAKRKRTTVVGVVVTLLLLLVIGIAGLIFWRLRRRQKEEQAELAEAKAIQFVDAPKEVTMLSINNYLAQDQNQNQNQSRSQTNQNRGQTTPASRKAAIMADMRNIETSASSSRRGKSSPIQGSPDSTTGLLASVAGEFDASGSSVATAGSRSGSVRSNSGFARFPTTSIRQSAKLQESNVFTTRSPESEFTDSTLRGGPEVFQHEDGGVARVSLPPPYADRLRRSQAASSSS
ncbi:hypothetical protein JR316_0012479 [Psilocybe cubensis]|uniref:Uncharacterized protein n=2 Tax=Psilocybe cubensis TaxID=181762 RepID=A0A8H7XQU8_PSICU|nr:hypothetical protein JR316_0012479 [Psilocybe cubensis]KAH9475368.1 hypothetical protein JR316_0012479 [Psilocybe cubensis]